MVYTASASPCRHFTAEIRRSAVTSQCSLQRKRSTAGKGRLSATNMPLLPAAVVTAGGPAGPGFGSLLGMHSVPDGTLVHSENADAAPGRGPPPGIKSRGPGRRAPVGRAPHAERARHARARVRQAALHARQVASHKLRRHRRSQPPCLVDMCKSMSGPGCSVSKLEQMTACENTCLRCSPASLKRSALLAPSLPGRGAARAGRAPRRGTSTSQASARSGA